MSTSLINIDRLKMYFGEPFFASDNIRILCPTIKEIVEFGEREYYSVVTTLCATPSDMKSALWDMKLDWEELSDFQLFIMLSQTFPQSKTKLLLGDVDLSKMKLYPHPENDGEVILADKESKIIIDEYVYLKIAEYIRQMHGLNKNVERAKNKRTKQVMIEYDRQLRESRSESEYKSMLFPLVTSLKAKMGYTLDYIGQMHIVEFMSDINRLNVIRNSDALLNAMYSGFCDISKIDRKELDWMKNIEIL